MRALVSTSMMQRLDIDEHVNAYTRLVYGHIVYSWKTVKKIEKISKKNSCKYEYSYPSLRFEFGWTLDMFHPDERAAYTQFT